VKNPQSATTVVFAGITIVVLAVEEELTPVEVGLFTETRKTVVI
jgi:hypothetical protein